MKRYVLSKPAERDLDQITAYLFEKAGPRVAREILHEVRAGIRFVASRPEAGHLREDLTDEPIRFWTIFSFLILYDLAREPVEVVRILHGARDVASILG